MERTYWQEKNLRSKRKPKKPDAPMVENVPGSSRVFCVSWTALSNTGRPPITSYDLQYR